MKIGILGICLLGVLAISNIKESAAGREKDRPAIGAEAGTKAPAFEARDQFGHEQTNETLKGRNGTVLLFFRSADW